MTSRRAFLKTSSLAAVATVGRKALGTPGRVPPTGYYSPGTLPRATDPDLKALSQLALDAAKGAGATYADVRFTITRWRTFAMGGFPKEREALAVGVRALANGAWGFTGRTHWAPDQMAQLGRKATEQAQAMGWSDVPPITLMDHPPAAAGHWTMPVQRDPFTVPIEEQMAWIASVHQEAEKYDLISDVALTFQRQERTFASTDGAYTTQTVYTSLGGVPHTSLPRSQILLASRMGGAAYVLPGISPIGAGYEVLADAHVPERINQAVATMQDIARAQRFTGLGEYDVVFDGAAMAALVNGTFGAALEYDRAVGYEANAGGTSYLTPPLEMLGTPVAAHSVTITADRTLPKGAATVQWDDEGVSPQSFQIVRSGTLMDYMTSREFVTELAPWYRRHGLPMQSRGCSASESAFSVPLVYSPNLRLEPNPQDTTLEALIAGVDDGYLVCGGNLDMDFQQTAGIGTGAVTYRIKHGKLAGAVKNAAYQVQTRAFWKNVMALGGASTATLDGFVTVKGQPSQVAVHSVQGVAAHVRRVQVVPAHL